jgi:tRNA nucleotidyltransferase (CCA-adding enzyme)
MVEKYKKILKEILESNLPSKKEINKIDSEVKLFVGIIQKTINELKINAVIKIGGSYAKGTFLKKDFDCDLFIRFNYEYKEKNISDTLGEILKNLNPIMIHGSRDYFQIFFKGIKFEIVPVLSINKPEMALNVTDCSPLHVDWIKKKIEKNKDLPKEILLTKLFTKSIGVYGAESYIKGFSGHVIDILIANYGSFIDLLKATQEWSILENIKTIVDIEKHSKINNKNKIEGPIVVVDPIQYDRNAAAALSFEKYELFINKAKEFLDKPTTDFFIKKEFNIKDISKLKNVIIIKASPLEGKIDIVGCKLLKIFEFIKKRIEEHEIIESGWHWDKEKECYFWFSVNKLKIPESYEHIGPPESQKSNSKSFIEKHKDAYLKNKRWYALVKRENFNLSDLVKHLIKDEYIMQRLENIEIYK